MVTPDLIGRQEELAQLIALTSNQEVGGVVIAGDAGVGKSRLADELARQLADDLGWTVVRLRATHSSSKLPLGAFAGLLPDDVPPGATQLDLCCRVARAVSPPGQGRRAVLIDDAHHLDDTSATVVGQLVGSSFVIMTIRGGAPAPDLVTALWKDGITARIDLPPLAESPAATLLEATLGGPVEASTARRIFAWTDGNPLFIREVVLAGQSSGSLACRAGLWCWHGGLSVTARLIELVTARLAGVPTCLRGLLELLAVGEPLEIALLGEHRRALALAEAASLATRVDARRDVVRLAHPLFGEVLRAGLDAGRSAQLHGELAHRLEEVGTTHHGDVLRLATWCLLAGHTPSDPQLLITASKQALAAGDHAAAARMALAARDAGAGAEAHLAWAEARYWAGHHDDVVEALGGVDWTSEPASLRAAAAILWSSAAFWGQGDAAGAGQLLAEAERGLDDHPLALEVVAHHASLAFFSAQLDETFRLGGRVLATKDVPSRSRLRAMPAVIGALAVGGQLTAARAAFDDAMPSALDHLVDLPEAAGELALGRCLAELLAGELDEADAVATAVYDAAAAEGGNEFVGTWALMRGRVALARGALHPARRWLREAVAGLDRHDPAALLCWAHALAATVEALCGDAPAARRALDRADATRNPAVTISAAELATARAWTLQAEGRLAAARDVVVDAAQAAQDAGLWAIAADTWSHAVRLGAARRAVAPLAQLAGALEGPLPAAHLSHVVGLVDDDGVRLDEAAGAFARCGALLLAAEASNAAARRHASAGRRGAELASRARARQFAGECGPEVTALVDAEDVALGQLTGREREVLELAARGLSNRQIATELFVSIRTVGNHLAHIYTKLAVPGRGSLASVVGAASR